MFWEEKKMYAWGGNTSDWRGSSSYNFDPARSPYLDKLAKDAGKRGPRAYARNREPDMGLVNPRGKEIVSESKNPIILAVDVTGSMASWPGEIFDRLPLLYQTLTQYREDAEFCFAAIGDAHSDTYPLQVNSFGKGLSLEEHVKALGCEGGGGGQVSESYELFGHYILNHCKTPNATSPFLLIFGDEKFYNQIDPAQVEHYIGDKLQAPLKSKEVWDKLLQKCNVYFLQKPYGGGDKSITAEVNEHWSKALGSQRVISIPSMERAVDIAMGLVARHWGQYGDFTKNLEARQPDKSVREAVHKTVHTSVPNLPTDATRSVVSKSAKGMDSSSLSKMFDDWKK